MWTHSTLGLHFPHVLKNYTWMQLTFLGVSSVFCSGITWLVAPCWILTTHVLFWYIMLLINGAQKHEWVLSGSNLQYRTSFCFVDSSIGSRDIILTRIASPAFSPHKINTLTSTSFRTTQSVSYRIKTTQNI